MTNSSKIKVTIAIALALVVAVAFFYFLLTQTSLFMPTGLIEDPEELLVEPNERHQERYIQSVEKFAKQAPQITIASGCTVSPLVIKIQENIPIAINNADSVKHTIAFEDEEANSYSFIIPPNETLDFLPRVRGKQTGAFRYQCTDISTEENVGVMYIVDKLQ